MKGLRDCFYKSLCVLQLCCVVVFAKLSSLETLDSEQVYSRHTVAVGDTAVLYCSFDVLYSQLGHVSSGQIDWMKLGWKKSKKVKLVAHGQDVLLKDKRYKVFMPHQSALSVLIIRKAKRRDAGKYRCHLSKSTKRFRIVTLEVAESKLNVVTGPAQIRTKPGSDVTLWCNATGVPTPMIYWRRIDQRTKRHGKTNDLFGTALTLHQPAREDSGVYACYLDNYLQPVQTYEFKVLVEEKPWNLDGYKMRFDSSKWFLGMDWEPRPVLNKSYLLMCETSGEPRPLPHITWYKNGRRLKTSRRYYIIEDKPTWKTNYMSSTLVIKKFTSKEQGTYICQGGNPYTTSKQEFRLIGMVTESYILEDKLAKQELTSTASILTTPEFESETTAPSQVDIETTQAHNTNSTSVGDDEDYTNGSGSGDEHIDANED